MMYRLIVLLIFFTFSLFSLQIEIQAPVIEKLYTDATYVFALKEGSLLDVKIEGNGTYEITSYNEKTNELLTKEIQSTPYIPNSNEIVNLSVYIKSPITLHIIIKPTLPFPVLGSDFDDIGGTFWVARGKRHHEGIDIFAKRNTPVISVCDNLLVVNDIDNALGGISLSLYDQKTQMYYYYTHLTLRLVFVGDIVSKNQVIGTVGNTGNAESTPNHLHFGIYKKHWTSPIDPLPFIKQYDIKKEFKFPDSIILKYKHDGYLIVSEGLNYIRVLKENRGEVDSKNVRQSDNETNKNSNEESNKVETIFDNNLQ